MECPVGMRNVRIGTRSVMWVPMKHEGRDELDGRIAQPPKVADTFVVLWDGEGTALDGLPYTNTIAWSLSMRDGLVVRAVALFDSIAFNDVWSRVQPAE